MPSAQVRDVIVLPICRRPAITSAPATYSSGHSPWRSMHQFAAALALLLLSTTAHSQHVEPGQLVETEVLSVKAPTSLGWSLAARSPARVVFSRLGQGPNETLTAMALVFRIDAPKSREDFAQLIKRSVAADTPAPRFRALSESLEHEEKGRADCIRYVAVHEDLEAKKMVASQQPLKMQSHTLYCRYLDNPGLALAVGFSRRGESAPDGSDEEAREFIRGAGLRQR